MAWFCARCNERRSLKTPRQFRAESVRLRRIADDGSRWRGPGLCHGFFAEEKNGVRRLGASLPMRMAASWFGSLDSPNTRLWRD